MGNELNASASDHGISNFKDRQVKIGEWQRQQRWVRSFGGPVEDRGFKEPPLKISGAADRYDHGVVMTIIPRREIYFI
jgi:hypothetical protein